MNKKVNFLNEEIDDQVLEKFGGKARNLNLMRGLDVNIPNGFVLNYKWEGIEAEIQNHIDTIGGFPVAVRSSGGLEDMGDASFAGLYETYLNINNFKDCLEAIKKCFDSAKGQRVINYLEKKKIKYTESDLLEGMNVLVQKMIVPVCSGVAFSINPITGKEENCLIESVEREGERLVSGTVTPSRYIFEYLEKKIIDEEIGSDNLELSETQVQDISESCLKIQAHFNHPQDIEWAIDREGKFWIIQSRPITHVSWRKDVAELTNADFKDGGISARVCTPFMYSLYQRAFNESMGKYFYDIGLKKQIIEKDWIFTFYGIAYWNASIVKESLFKIPGFDEQKFDLDLGIQKDYGESGPHKTPNKIGIILGAIPVLLKLNKEFKSSEDNVVHFKENFPKEDESWKRYLEVMKNDEDDVFFEKYIEMHHFFLNTEKNYFRTIYNNSNYQSEFKEFLEKFSKKKKIKINELALMGGLAEISHLEIQKDLNRLSSSLKENGRDHADTQKAFEHFMNKHYHHSDSELDLSVPRWGEVPERVWKMAETNQVGSSESHSDYEQEFKSLQRKINKKSFFKKLERSRNFLVKREKMREFSTRAYYIVRLMTLELASRFEKRSLLKEKNDIFFLTAEEILKICHSKAKISEQDKLIHIRKLMYQGYKNFSPPNEFGGSVEQVSSYSEAEGIFKGVPCSTGLVKARVFVAKELKETEQLKQGDILITKFTDPGWTPILSKVSGVVTEVGGVLSHAAVISREYGIPAVLNISNITNSLKTGQIIELNGDTGTIKVIDE